MIPRGWILSVLGAAALVIGAPLVLLAQRPTSVPPLVRFVEATQDDERVSSAALREIAADWKDSYTAMFTDIARLMKAPRRSTLDAPADADGLAVDGDDSNDGARRPSNALPK